MEETVNFTGNIPPPGNGTVESELTLMAVVTTALRHGKVLFGVPIVVGVLGAVIGLAKGPDYAAQSSFLPEGGVNGTLGQYAGLASQLGVSLPSAGDGESAGFYAKLLTSPALLKETVLTEYKFADPKESGDTTAGNLVDLYGIMDAKPNAAIVQAVATLEEHVSIQTDLSADLVTLTTKARWPELSTLINRRMLGLVQDFNMTKRRTRALKERDFVAGRLEVADRDLRNAEASMQMFLEKNRDYKDSPELTFEANRLQRRVSFRQQVYSSLLEASERAQIEAVRNTPVITIVNAPEGLVERESPIAMMMALGFGVGILVAIGWVAVVEYVAYQRIHNEEQFQLFVEARRALLRRSRR